MTDEQKDKEEGEEEKEEEDEEAYKEGNVCLKERDGDFGTGLTPIG